MSSLERARRLLSRRFGHADFRPLQRRVVEAMLEGRDVVAVLPTGYGKSACFQVPSALQPGTTVVVSPLISLIEDQVGRARARGFHAFGWTSGAEGIDRALARA
ncbi:MAG: DEAD/DEAH box helicase, partial [Gemmatimonadetes bacterium]|nr:DEAD/DEAH box helicase [Gemmatimonadota bacterium]